jgi:hypothetical protein
MAEEAKANDSASSKVIEASQGANLSEETDQACAKSACEQKLIILPHSTGPLLAQV